MAEFERKKRYISYHDSKCKMYLRNDFNKKCAYCLIREGDLGSPDNFEKDHFFPQKGQTGVGKVHFKYNGEVFDVDNYYNLYYSCKRCNGRGGKSNTWSPTLLDPCVDDIWDKHIKCKENDIIISSTEQGEEYIQTFKLNSRLAVKTRKAISESKKDIEVRLHELEKVILRIDDEETINILKKEYELDFARFKYGSKYDVNFTYLNEDKIREAEDILSRYSLGCGTGDFELDYNIVLNGINYDVKLNIEDEIIFNEQGEKNYFLRVQQVKDWMDKQVIICHYDCKNKKLYYIIFSVITKSKIVAENIEKIGYSLKMKDVM